MRLRVPEGRSHAAIGLLVAGLLAPACGSPPVGEIGSGQPDIVLILIDDLRPDLGTYGHPVVRSPHIDRLAARGVRFERAYAQSPNCNPSRTSLLTGLRPDRTGVLDNRTPFPDAETGIVSLPEWFRRHGYFTAAVGKIFHGSGRRGGVGQRDPWTLAIFPRRGSRAAKRVDPDPLQGRVGRYSWRGSTEPEEYLKDVRVAHRAVELIERPRQQPLFLAVGLTATHPHFVAPARYFDLYPVDTIELQRAEPQLASRLEMLHGWSDESLNPMSATHKKELIRAYWSCVSFVDDQVGKLMKALERTGRIDETIVVLVSDHGVHMGEQGWWTKRTLYEASTRVPLILSAPGVAAPGTGREQLVELIDLFPTLVELAGLEAPAGIEGRSLVPLLRDPRSDWDAVAYSQVRIGRTTGRSVRTRDRRYSEWSGNRQWVELFDLSTEVVEGVDRSSDPAYADDRRRLSKLLQESVPGAAGLPDWQGE